MKSLGSQGCKRWLPACTNCVESESCLGAFGQRGRLAHRMCFPSFNEIRIRQYVSHMKCVCVCACVFAKIYICLRLLHFEDSIKCLMASRTKYSIKRIMGPGVRSRTRTQHQNVPLKCPMESIRYETRSTRALNIRSVLENRN